MCIRKLELEAVAYRPEPSTNGNQALARCTVRLGDYGPYRLKRRHDPAVNHSRLDSLPAVGTLRVEGGYDGAVWKLEREAFR